MPDLQKGLIGHWTMDSADTDGSTIRDRSAYDNHGTLNGGVTTGNPSPVGDSYSFDGSDDYIQNNNIGYKDIPITFSAWINKKTGQKTDIVGLGSSSGETTEMGITALSDGNLKILYYRDDNASGFSADLNNTGWHHVVGVIDSSSLQIAYVDGSEVGRNQGSNDYTGGADLKIGYHRDGSPSYFEGEISDVRVYNRALSQSEVNQLYNFRGNSRKSQTTVVAGDSLQAWYPFLQGGAADKSGNGNDGTVNGATYNGNGGPEGLGAYGFDGNDYIDTGDIETSDPATVTMWIKLNSSPNDTRPFSTTTGGTNLSGSWGLNSNGNNDFVVWNGSEWKTVADLNQSNFSVGCWTMFSATYDSSGNVVGYIDSEKKQTSSSVTFDFNGNQSAISGLYDGDNGNRINGEISDVRVYNRALSQSEINQLYDPKSVNLDRGLVGHWSMDDSDVSGGTLYDRSAFDNHGTLNGGITKGVLTPIGDGFAFDGTSGYIQTSVNASLQRYTVAAWVYKVSESSNNARMLFSGGYGGDPANIVVATEEYSTTTSSLNTDTTACTWNTGWINGEEVAQGTAIPLNEWVHVAVDLTVDVADNREQRIGANTNGSNYFEGDLSDARIYNRALSQSEITQLYNQRSKRTHGMTNVPVAQQDLVAYYPFASSGATDQSGNGNDGTVNGPTFVDDGGIEANGSYDFDGDDDRIVWPSEYEIYESDQDEWSISCWFNVEGDPSSVGEQTIVDNNGRYHLQIDSNGQMESIPGGEEMDWSWYPDRNLWHHAVLVYDGAGKLLGYNNGEFAESRIGVSPETDTYENLFGLGEHNPDDPSSGNNRWFKGSIGDLRVYNRALSKYEVKRLYENEGAVFGGIEKGYKSSDLSFFANQWNGSSNTGEVDITGSQFTKRNGEVIDITPIDNGVALQEGALQEGGSVSGVEGYIMYSEEPVHDRFSDNPPNSSNGDHLVGVRKNGETWEYDDNGSFHEFSPRPTDHLIAEVGWGVDFVNGLNIYS